MSRVIKIFFPNLNKKPESTMDRWILRNRNKQLFSCGFSILYICTTRPWKIWFLAYAIQHLTHNKSFIHAPTCIQMKAAKHYFSLMLLNIRLHLSNIFSWAKKIWFCLPTVIGILCVIYPPQVFSQVPWQADCVNWFYSIM